MVGDAVVTYAYKYINERLYEHKGLNNTSTLKLRPGDAYIRQHTNPSDNGLWPDRHQAIIWTIAGMLLIGSLETNFSEILNLNVRGPS